jgi:hypothetical protein
MGRICYGIEVDPLYIDTSIRRWQKYTGGEAVHTVSKKTFAQITAERMRKDRGSQSAKAVSGHPALVGHPLQRFQMVLLLIGLAEFRSPGKSHSLPPDSPRSISRISSVWRAMCVAAVSNLMATVPALHGGSGVLQ